MSPSKDVDVVSLWDIINITKRRAAEQGLSVKFDPNADTARYNPSTKTITYPTIEMPISEEEYTNLRHYYIHEPLHHLRQRTMTLAKEYGDALPKEMHTIWNIVEDFSMEKLHIEEYAGDGKTISESHSYLNRAFISTIKKHGTSDISEDAVKFVGVDMMCLKARSKFDPLASLGYSEIMSELPPKIREFIEVLEEKGVDEWIDSDPSQDGVHSISRELYRILFDKEPPPEPPPQEGEGEGGGSEGELSNEDKQGISEAAAKAGEEAEDKAYTKQKIHWKDIKKMPDTGMRGESSIDWQGKEITCSKSWSPRQGDGRNVIDYTKKMLRGSSPSSWMEDGVNDRALANQIRRLLLVMQRQRLLTEQKSGKIHNRNLAKIAMPNGSVDKQRIFKRKQDGLKLDVCVQVLVDCSGSMSGEPMGMAVKAVRSMLYLFDKTLHIPSEVLTFGESYDSFDFGIIKPFTEHRYTDQVICDRMRNFQANVIGNPDADAIVFAASRLAKRKERRKVLIVLSDGSPTEACDSLDNYVDADEALHTAIANIRTHHKDIEMYGIGIQDDNVTRYYGKDAQVVNRLEDLSPALLTTIKNGVLA